MMQQMMVMQMMSNQQAQNSAMITAAVSSIYISLRVQQGCLEPGMRDLTVPVESAHDTPLDSSWPASVHEIMHRLVHDTI